MRDIITEEQKKLIEKYYPVVQKYCKLMSGYFFTGEDFHGLFSETLIRAVKTYNAEKQASMNTYLHACLNNAMRTWIIRSKKSRAISKQVISVDKYSDLVYSGNKLDKKLVKEMSDALSDNIDADGGLLSMEMAGTVFKDEDNRTVDIIRLYFAERRTMDYIGKEYGISKNRVSDIIHSFLRRARKKLEKVGYSSETG